MSEKKRQKKEGRDKNKKNQAMRQSKARPTKNAKAIAVEPSPLPGTDIKPKPGVRGIV